MSESTDGQNEIPPDPAPPQQHSEDAEFTLTPTAGQTTQAQRLPTHIYAIGRIEPRFPTLGIEKELAQVAATTGDTSGLTDRQALHSLLSRDENRYLARQLCWVFMVEGIETYILHPRDPLDIDLLLESIRPVPRSSDADVVIGQMGPLAPPEACNGLLLPIVVFDQLYSFDVDALVASIPQPAEAEVQDFAVVAEDLFLRVAQLADNAGATDEHRALNYLAVRYPAIYHQAAAQLSANSTLAGVDVLPSRLSGPRKIVDVVFSYRHRVTDVGEEYFVRVDVTEQFPFLVTKLSPYFGRR